jgi:2-desacetyl-2-hydroxyethyl bacteriochlorophyllide A dehydrogenase
MKAALVQPGGKLRVEDVPSPEPGPGEVVVRVAYCGICGSDIHMLATGMLPEGCIIGHELSGRVAAVGEGVDGWRKGDPVLAMPFDPCFSCEPCRRGDTQVCHDMIPRGYGLGINPGGFAEYMRVKPSMLFRVPDGLGLREAALNEPWAVAVHGVNLSGFRVGGRALVMGAGPIGLMTLFALRAAGASEIYVSEPDAHRAQQARDAGADLVIDPSRESVEASVREKNGSLPKHVFDCAGTEASIQEAVTFADVHGRVEVLGVHMNNALIFPPSAFMKEVSLHFSFGYTYREFGQCLHLLARNALDPEKLISSTLPLDRIQEAFEMLESFGQMKVLIDCGQG